MIARLKGQLLEKKPHQVILDAGGVGYRVFIPLSTFYALPEEGQETSLRTHTHVREDVIALYGFVTTEEQTLFERLIEISGIGPRLALAILSGLPAEELVEAISRGDSACLRGIPGVGPKTADRVMLEMRDRIGAIRAATATIGGSMTEGGSRAEGDSIRRDVVSALVNLGYRESQADSAARRALERRSDGDGLQDVLRQSLRLLAS